MAATLPVEKELWREAAYWLRAHFSFLFFLSRGFEPILFSLVCVQGNRTSFCKSHWKGGPGTLHALSLQRACGSCTRWVLLRFTEAVLGRQHAKSQPAFHKYAYISVSDLPAWIRDYSILRHIKFHVNSILVWHEIYCSLTVHFSYDTHTGIHLAFNNIMMIDLLVKTIVFQMVINQNESLRICTNTGVGIQGHCPLLVCIHFGS